MKRYEGRARSRLSALLSALVLPAALPPAAAVFNGAAVGKAQEGRPAPDSQRRLAPPPLKCARDNTTSFTGRVLAFRRGGGQVFIRVRTDEETTEQFRLWYGRSGDPKRLFLLRGGAFRESDWGRIVRRDGGLRRGVRATVWACYEGDKLTAEVIDWLPPEE